jgi:hypothetical protein
LQSFRIKEQPLHLRSTSFLSVCLSVCLSVSPPLPTLSLSPPVAPLFRCAILAFCVSRCFFPPSLFNETAFRALSSKQFFVVSLFWCLCTSLS